ncbi:MAG: sigma-70 family RNA polymerase sigma factor [Niastella sp.]|nr:sigma-70 family RNA polymerase sigma factor [Niastella sp.]
MPQDNLNPINQSEQWLTEIYRQEYFGLMRYIRGFVKEKEQAEDILGDSMLKLYRKVEKTPGAFATSANLKNFLVTTIRNACLTYLSKEHPHNKIELDEMIADDAHAALQLEKSENLLLLQSFINKLSGRLQQVAHLAWVEGCSVEETVQRMEIGKESVSVYRTRALNELRRLILSQGGHLSLDEIFMLLWLLYALF